MIIYYFLRNSTKFIFDIFISEYTIRKWTMKVCENPILLVFGPYNMYLRIDSVLIL